MSTKTGTQPAPTIAPGVPTKLYAVVTTSAPGETRAACRASASEKVPFEHSAAWRAPT